MSGMKEQLPAAEGNRQTGLERYIKGLSGWMLAILTLVLLVGAPYSASASGDWDAAWNGMDAVFRQVETLESAVKLEALEIQALRKRNQSALSEVNAAIKQIDAQKLKTLKAAVEQIQRKHDPLIKQYSDLGKRAAAARRGKDRRTAERLDLKRNQIKGSVTAARTEIGRAKDAYSAARKEAAAKSKRMKDAIQPVQPLKKQVAAENAKISGAKKLRTAAEKRYRSAVKQGNAVAAMAEIGLIAKELGSIHASQQSIYGWEQRIGQIAAGAKAMIPR